MALALATTAYLTHRLLGPDRSIFVSGEATHGHYQIGLACNACHTPWKGVDARSCIDCHGAALKAANDSHGAGKFADPRNADRLEHIDATSCIACHREHLPEITRPMGLTVPADFCFHCHTQIAQDRPSHRSFSFDDCAAAGCHNYHDNTALYEDLLLKHLRDPDTREGGLVPTRTREATAGQTPGAPREPLTVNEGDAPPGPRDPELLQQWESTAHARGGVNCGDCHRIAEQNGGARRWTDHPGDASCVSCHPGEVDGFGAGRHGMRGALDLPPMTPGKARLQMKAEAAGREVTCTSCHQAHLFDLHHAAVDACLGCHDDRHSLAYGRSAHASAFAAERSGLGPPGSGVSCATCHLPRLVEVRAGQSRVSVQHNQNATLRPVEKMIRASCLHCHGLGLAIDALADKALGQDNYHGAPAQRVESLELAERRLLEKVNP